MPEHDVFLRRVVAGPIATNAYLVGDRVEGSALLIDPARGAAAPLLEAARVEGLTVQGIVNTHGHWDHIADNADAQGLAQVGIAVHEADIDLLRNPRPGSIPFEVPATEPERTLVEGDVVEVGRFRFDVLHTPGHSAGSICLYERRTGMLIAGDTLFAGSCGRYDLPGGDPAALADSLERLAELPDEVEVYNGHGPETSIGAERDTLPELVSLLRDAARAASEA